MISGHAEVEIGVRQTHEVLVAVTTNDATRSPFASIWIRPEHPRLPRKHTGSTVLGRKPLIEHYGTRYGIEALNPQAGLIDIDDPGDTWNAGVQHKTAAPRA